MTHVKPESRPEEDSSKKDGSRLSTWIALGSAAVAIIAALIAYKQVNATNQQIIVAEQQQLLSLCTTIATQLDQEQPSGSIDQVTELDILNVEGQSAEATISELHGNGVTSIEYDEVARALSNSFDESQAIAYFQDAVYAPPHDVGVQSEALRAEGNLYYNIGYPVIGHYYVMRSVNVYSGHVMSSKYGMDNNIAQSYLDDARYQLNIRPCTTAATDIMNAEKLLAQAGGTDATNAPTLATEQEKYNRLCPQG